MEKISEHERAMYKYLGYEAAENIANMEIRSLNEFKRKLNEKNRRTESRDTKEHAKKS